MDGGLTRRTFLAAGAAVGVLGTAHVAADELEDAGNRPDRRPETPVDVRGAVYMPTRAFNTYQTWANYDRREVERDLGYAARLNLNALRTWLSYEYWREEPGKLEKRIDHFLETAKRNGIRVLLGVFEAVGVEPKPQWRNITDPWYALPLRTPPIALMRRKRKWEGPREMVRWFMDRHRDDERLLAIELMNEPGWWDPVRAFSYSMFVTLRENRGSVPLTVGSTSLANDAEYANWGCDVLQFHYNNPRTHGDCRAALRQATTVSDSLDRPVWLTEWQRIGRFGRDDVVGGDHWQPDYASMASPIREAGVGNFFWSLMVKPAYRRTLRRQGLLNGLFHEDGAVWSADDARAIEAMSGTRTFDGRERREWPEWAAAVEERAFGESN